MRSRSWVRLPPSQLDSAFMRHHHTSVAQWPSDGLQNRTWRLRLLATDDSFQACLAFVAQWQSSGLLSRGLGVRIPPSALVWMRPYNFCPHRLAAKTPVCRTENRGSIPRGGAVAGVAQWESNSRRKPCLSAAFSDFGSEFREVLRDEWVVGRGCGSNRQVPPPALRVVNCGAVMYRILPALHADLKVSPVQPFSPQPRSYVRSSDVASYFGSDGSTPSPLFGGAFYWHRSSLRTLDQGRLKVGRFFLPGRCSPVTAVSIWDTSPSKREMRVRIPLLILLWGSEVSVTSNPTVARSNRAICFGRCSSVAEHRNPNAEANVLPAALQSLRDG
jgi:hypothetical protein